MLDVASGLVAGLVAITPAAGFVSPMAAIAIGGIAGAICYGGSSTTASTARFTANRPVAAWERQPTETDKESAALADHPR